MSHAEKCNHTLNYLKWLKRTEKSISLFPTDRVIRFKKTENPLDHDIPTSQPTEISCNWLRLCIPADILLIKSLNKPFIRQGLVNTISSFSYTETKNTGDQYDGDHTITLQIYHKPETCDFSHCQFDLIHRFPINSLYEERRYTSQNWKSAENILRTKGHSTQFFKKFRDALLIRISGIFEPLDENLTKKPSFEFISHFKTRFVRNNFCFLAFYTLRRRNI